MKAEFQMQLNTQRGSLERVLRTVRHRGFNITALNVAQIDTTPYFNVSLSVESQRPMSLLAKQLNKLFDVSQLKVLEEVSYAQTA